MGKGCYLEVAVAAEEVVVGVELVHLSVVVLLLEDQSCGHLQLSCLQLVQLVRLQM